MITKKFSYYCLQHDFGTNSSPEYASHKRWQHKKRASKLDTAKNPDKAKKTPAKKKAVKKRGRKLRQQSYQHIPRPENFSIAGCGIDIYYEHLTYIPDMETDTVEYLDREKVCKKCRKRYKLDEAFRKRRRK